MPLAWVSCAGSRFRGTNREFVQSNECEGYSSPYLDRCRHDDYRTGTRLIFSRDTGHHSSGWLKNPDYERCWHLSLSPLPSVICVPGRLAELDKRMAARWVRAFFADDVSKVWAEGPFSAIGKAHGVWHWRLFCDEHWEPILPRKEVYTREFTEAGWRSASEVLALDGWHASETEGGRVIESTVDPRGELDRGAGHARNSAADDLERIARERGYG
jgi:hypothetical protein